MHLLNTGISELCYFLVYLIFMSNVIYGNWQQILKECIDSLYTSAVAETSIAHQWYMFLLALTINHSLADKIKETSL